ncbi:MAG: hypothetical protein AB1451_16160 [Nitrospirota bacterium]
MRAVMRRMCSRGSRISALVVLASLPLIIGCSDGDGDGGGITYTGLTTPVVIDGSNAQEIAAGAYTGGSVGGPLSVVGVAQAGVGVSTRQSLPLALSRSVKRAAGELRAGSSPEQVAAGAVVTETDTIDGDCGGHLNTRVNMNDATGEFTGSLNFDAFCVDGVTTRGSASASGQFDFATDDIEFLMTTSSLRVEFEGESFTMAGAVNAAYSGSSSTITMNTLMRDDGTGKVFRAENYEVTVTEGSSSVEETLSGRFYHPDFGYVDLSTPTPFVTNVSDTYPSSGVLIASGDGQTKARLTALSSTTLQIEADTDGNGDYDYDSGTLNWADL